MAGNLVLFVSTSFLLSTPRYVLTLFPLFVALALATRRTWAAGRGLRRLAGGLGLLRRPVRDRRVGLLSMGRALRWTDAPLAALAVPAIGRVASAGACGPPSAPAGSARWLGRARVGDGPYGLVLVHDEGRMPLSWGIPQAATFADQGMTVLAVESATPASVVDAWAAGSWRSRAGASGAAGRR